ncbi:MAG: hypothetical protein M3R68_05460 [Acidobacteriota bacterium]|nr:hypothetical protein [Acidobacteriota bacterium]
MFRAVFAVVKIGAAGEDVELKAGGNIPPAVDAKGTGQFQPGATPLGKDTEKGIPNTEGDQAQGQNS